MLFEFRSVRAVGLGVARRVLLNNINARSRVSDDCWVATTDF